MKTEVCKWPGWLKKGLKNKLVKKLCHQKLNRLSALPIMSLQRANITALLTNKVEKETASILKSFSTHVTSDWPWHL